MEFTKELLPQSLVELEQVLTSLTRRLDAELLALSERELAERWFFRWNPAASLEWNLYKFSDSLEMFKRSCRQWEEHHNGGGCVVERVRDKYLMPKIRAFTAELNAHSARLNDSEGAL